MSRKDLRALSKATVEGARSEAAAEVLRKGEADANGGTWECDMLSYTKAWSATSAVACEKEKDAH